MGAESILKIDVVDRGVNTELKTLKFCKLQKSFSSPYA